MAKVKIQGHASGTGTLTVTAPNTSTDRTITLPDATATLFTDAGGTITGNLTVSNTEPQIHLSDTDATASGYAKIRGGASGAVFLEADPTNAESSSHITFKVDNTQMGRFTTDGLCFNSDSAAANALDDYEEGTWTPTYTSASGSFGAMTYTSGGGVGRYTKIGNLVTLMCQMGTDSVTVSTASGALRISGLPYTPSNVGAGNWGQGITSQNWGGDNPMGVQIQENQDWLNLYYKTSANGNISSLNVTDMDTGGDSNYSRFTLAYITS